MKNQVIKFFIITFIFSWLLWLPTILHAQWQKMPSGLLLLGMFAGFAPSIVGVIMLKKETGREFKSHMKKRFNLSFPKKWLLIMMIFPAQSALSLFLVKVIEKDFTVVNPISPMMFPLIFLQILFIGGAIGEEFGWRGYALDKLQKVLSPFNATLLLGVLWSLWHLPLFYMLNTVQSNLPLWQFMLQNTVIAFIYTWIYNKTKGNIILMILLHAVLNTSSAMFPYWQSNLGRFIGVGLLIVILIGIKLVDETFLRKTSVFIGETINDNHC